jgi:hypothetical protein
VYLHCTVAGTQGMDGCFVIYRPPHGARGLTAFRRTQAAFVFPATRRRLLIGLAVLSGSRQTYTICTVTVLRHGCLLSPRPMPAVPCDLSSHSCYRSSCELEPIDLINRFHLFQTSMRNLGRGNGITDRRFSEEKQFKLGARFV